MHQFQIILYTLFFVWAPAFAQQPYFKNYKVRDGLPSNNVYFVFQDSKNYIWFCTDVGVSRFDGAHFSNFTTADGLSDNEVFMCYEDHAGRIWFATLNGKPCFFQDGEMHNEHNTPLLHGLSLGGLMLHVFETENGEIIMASRENLCRLNFKKKTASLEPMPEILFQLWPMKGDTIGVISDSVTVGFFYQKKVTETGKLPYIVQPIKWSNWQDTLYLTNIHSLLVYNNLKHKIISISSFSSTMNEAISITPMADRLWIGSRNGAYLFDRHKLQLRKVYLPGTQVSAILEDREGGWWFSTLDDGVFYTPAPEILQILDAGGNSPGQVNCLSADATGRLWLGMPNNTFSTFEGGRLAAFRHFPKGLTPRAVSSIRQLPDGSTLVSGKAGMAWIKDGKQQFLLLRSTDVNMDGEGNFWSGLTGLYLVPKAKTRLLNIDDNYMAEAQVSKFYKKYAPEKLSDTRVDRIVFDQSNTAWLASPSGLFFYGNEQMSDAVLSHNVRDLVFEEKTNTLWALTESSGLFALRNGRVLDSIAITSVAKRPKICRDFCQDANGHFWIATASGLMKVEGSPGSLRLFDYSNVHGIGAEKLNAVEVIGKQVFLGKDDGLLAVPMSIFSKKLLPPPIYLIKLKVNEKEQGFDHPLQLAFGENSLSFSFEGLSFKDYKNLQYRYRLQGHEADWHTTTSGVVEYASLRPGKYHFEVFAKNSSGVESEVPAVLDFSIAKPFWMQWWFVTVATGSLAGLVFLWVKRRERKLRRNYEYQRRLMETENEKLELQSKNADLKMLALRLQMNPHFIFNALNTIKGYYGQEKFKQANSYIAKFARLLRLNLDYSDSFIPLDQEMELLKIYLQLSQIRYPEKIKFTITAGPEVNVSGLLIPSMVVQPFVENAVIHGIVGKAGLGHIGVHFSKNKNEIVATVKDDGIGRLAAAAKSKLRDPHKPLATAITEERLQLLRKTGVAPAVEIMDLKNEDGEALGTEVVVRLPYETLIKN